MRLSPRFDVSLSSRIQTLIAFLFLVFLPAAALSQIDRTEVNILYKAATDYERLGRFDLAADKYGELFRMLPQSAAYYNGYKRSLQRLNRWQELIAAIRLRLQVVNNPATWADLGLAFYRAHDKKEAIRIWNDTLERFKRNRATYALVASAMLQNNLIEEAIEVYQRGRTELGDRNLFALELANAYAARLEYSAALKEFIAFLEQNPRQLPYVQQRVLSFFTQDADEQILQALDVHIRARSSVSYELLSLKANSLTRLKRYREALTVFQQLNQLQPGDQRTAQNGKDLYEFAVQMQKLGEFQIAIEAFRILADNNPTSPYRPAAQIGLAESLIGAGLYDPATRALDGIIETTKNGNYLLRAQMLKGKLYLDHLNQPALAQQVFLAVYENNRSPEAQKQAALALGDVHFRLGNTAEAEIWYDRAFSMFSDKDQIYRNQVYFRLAELAFCQHLFRRAISILEKIEQNPPGSRAENDLENDALELILLIEQSLPDSATALRLYAHSRCLAERMAYEQAADSLRALVTRYPQTSLAPKALMDLAEVYAYLGLASEKIMAYHRVTSEYAQSIYADEATYRLAKAFEEAGDVGQALETYEKLLVDFPNSIYLEEARRRIRSLREAGSMQ